MREDLTYQQKEIIDSNVKVEISWLFQIDTDLDGTPDLYYSTKGKTWDGQAYTYKIMDFTPPELTKGNPEGNHLPGSSMTIILTNKDNTLLSSDFEGADIKVMLVVKADLAMAFEAGDLEFEAGDLEFEAPDYQEAELMAWRFKVKHAYGTYQKLVLECVDWFNEYLEGDYPNTPMVSDLFPLKQMKIDNMCVPLVFGQPYPLLRWIMYWQTVTYVDADTFTVSGDQTALFVAGQYVYCNCGVDGYKSCWVDSSSHAAGTTTVDLTAGSDDLTSNLTKAAVDGYILGSNTPTYTMNRACVPREMNFRGTFLPANYTFRQVSFVGSNSVSYKAVQLIAVDYDKNGTNDTNGFWGTPGKEIHDVPFRFTRDDTVSETSPEEIFEYALEDMGVPSGQIDDTALSTANTTYTARSLTFDVGLYYTMPSKEFICKLLTMGNACYIIRDKIYFKVLSTTSKLTLEKGMIATPGSFKITPAFTQKRKDCGYILWQESTEPIDMLNKSLVAAKSTTDNKSDVEIDCQWILDSQKAQKAGKLALQRRLLRDKKITFDAKMKFLLYEPGDMITINPADYGTDGTPYKVEIEKMTIGKGGLIKVECIRYSQDLDDWGDLSASAITIESMEEGRGYSNVQQGTSDADGNAGTDTNVVQGTIYMAPGADINLEGEDDDPAIIKWSGGTYSVDMGMSTSGEGFAIRALTPDVSQLYIGVDWGAGEAYRFNGITMYVSNSIGIQVDSTQFAFTSTDFRQLGTPKTIDLGTSTYVWKTLHTDNIVTYNVDAPITITPNSSASAPTHSAAKGTLYVTSAGILYINTDGSTTWAKVGGQ